MPFWGGMYIFMGECIYLWEVPNSVKINALVCNILILVAMYHTICFVRSTASNGTHVSNDKMYILHTAILVMRKGQVCHSVIH